MIRNYFKIALRSIKSNKGYTSLNIFGLAIGITAAALILLWVEDELNYNTYFENNENIFTVLNSQTYGEETFVFRSTPGRLAEPMRNEIPGIGTVARSFSATPVLSYDDQNFQQSGKYVDGDFFSIFDLEFIEGRPSAAFTNLNSIIVTESTARKFFNSTNVLNKIIQIDHNQSVTITAVVKDLPENVSGELKFEWLAPFELFENSNSWVDSWNNGIQTYVKPEATADIAAINNMMYGFIQKRNENSNNHLSLYPMSRWRLYSNFDSNGNEQEGIYKYVKLFSIIAIIILIIACINFMNLATARSEKRAKEIGVRKVLGAQRARLIYQFLSESVVMAFFAMILAVILVYIFSGSFNELVNKQLSVELLNPVHFIFILGIPLICGLFAGSFPSYYLSSFSPVRVIKGIRVKSDSASYVRKGLVIFQFSISIVFIIATVLVYQQIRHVQDRDLGYSNENLVFLQASENIQKNYESIRNDLTGSEAINEVSLSRGTPLSIGSNGSGINWQGKDPESDILISFEWVSPSYIETTGMELIKGRDFNPHLASNESQIIVNETFARLIDEKDVLGKIITAGEEQFTVRGVIKDFVFNDIKNENAGPLMLFASDSGLNYLTVNLNKDQLSAGITAIDNAMSKYNPGNPVELVYADENLEARLSSERMVGKLAGIFAGLAIIISCLGLFGLAAFTAEKRIKEIGIRKVLGASVGNITTLLSVDFLKLVAIACLIAFPVAWWFGKDWLENYPYRVEISFWIFLIAGVGALLIALLTVSFQAIKAAIANPVKSLRTE